MEDNDECIEEAFPLNNISADGVPSSPSPSTRGSLRGPFLEKVKQNDVEGVRMLAREHRSSDSSACDELGRTALIVAIDEGNYDMIKCLLELQCDPGDALFHAVSVQSTAAVKIICKNLPEACNSHIINRFPSDHHYPAVITPLLLAGKNNSFEMIEVLLHHGAELPNLNDLVHRAGSDPYLKFLALVNWYEAASNETYILLTSDDPLDTIFKLGQSVQEAEETLKVPLFGVESERIENKLADLSVQLLSLARDSGEIGVLLRGGEEGSAHPKVPLRIQEALEINSFKKFVCHPSSQAYMLNLWDIPRPRLAKHSRFLYLYLFNAMVVLLYPVLCVAYILFPWKMAHVMKTPKIRFLVHAGSRLTLLFILIWSTHSWVVDLLVTTDYSAIKVSSKQLFHMYVLSLTTLTPVITIILVWIAGMTLRMIKQLWSHGVSFYLSNGWHILDCLQLILYWIYIIAGLVAFFKSHSIVEAEGLSAMSTSTEQGFFGVNISAQELYTAESITGSPGATVISDKDRPTKIHTWQDFQSQLVSEAAFAIANVLSFLQILHHLLAFNMIGPLLVSFFGMAQDVLKFFMIFGFLLVSFSIGLTQLYHKFEALEIKACRIEAKTCQETPFLNFWNSMGSLFWSLFDIIDLGSLEVEEGLAFTEAVGVALYAAFMLIGSMVLLNALIAMMSNTYTRVEENSEVEWKLARTKIMAEYISEKASLPPPFNLVPTVKFVVWLYRSVCRRCCRSDNLTSQQLSEHDEATDQRGSQNDAYKGVSRVLGERCLRAMDIKRSESQTSSDFKTLKNSVDKFSCEVAGIQQQLKCILESLNHRKGMVATGDCPIGEATT